ncbi:hypothetical protein [Streptomyces sp. NPDC054975]
MKSTFEGLLMRATRRTIRTAAIATGTVAALALPTAGAFAADQPTPAAVTHDDQSNESDQSNQSDQSARPESTDDQGGQDQDQQKQGDPVVGRIFVQSYKLADGSVAKVFMTTPQDYQAEIWAGGTLIDTLTTSGQPAYGQNNGLHVVLQPDGTVSSWLDNAPKPDPKPTPKPRPKPTPKPAPKPAPHADARITMPDGNVAKFYKKARRVEVSTPKGHRLATLGPKNPVAAHKGWTYKVVDAGKGQYKFVVIDTPRQGGNSWVYDFHGKLVEKYRAQKGTAGKKVTTSTVVPQGALPQGAAKAGVENVADSSHEATLVGAGGGLAALGAAALGFALYHRRSQES